MLESLDAIGRVVHIESYFSFRTARRTITPVDQAKDILPHAVYPLVAQLRAGTGSGRGADRDRRASTSAPAATSTRWLRLGEATGVLLVTLNGRPVEQYQNIIAHQRLVPRRLHHRRRDAAGRAGRRPRRAVHARTAAPGRR